ncbi:MAG: C40 family peptidase [Chlorobiota bacterium]|jgi:lipoprotein Spr|nr:C40 family peptidase [Chlorobiota bacterium]QQS66165.1 MAG: C40 family peptidase [Chlorobiota bacterium]
MTRFSLSKSLAQCFLTLTFIVVPFLNDNSSTLYANVIRKAKRGNAISAMENSKRMLAKKLPDIAILAGLNLADYKNLEVENLSGGEYPDPTKSHLIEKVSINKYNEDSFEDEANLEEQENNENVVEDTEYMKSEFLGFLSTMSPQKSFQDNILFNNHSEGLIKTVMNWLGTRYRYGGMGRNGIDCSAYTGTVFRAIGVNLPRTARMQYNVGSTISRENLQYGDLIFFNTRGGVSHVGIYLGNDLFTHSSSRYGVTVSELTASYYSARYIGGRRVTSFSENISSN